MIDEAPTVRPSRDNPYYVHSTVILRIIDKTME